MQNGPQLWAEILTYLPKGIIAGGAVRDFYLGVEPKDIDIFLPRGEVPSSLDEPFTYLGVPEDRKAEYEGKTGVRTVMDYSFRGFNVQLIELDTFDLDAMQLVDSFDLAITQCWFDGQVRRTSLAVSDFENSTVTVLLEDRIHRTMVRVDRFMRRHPGQFTLVNPFEMVAA